MMSRDLGGIQQVFIDYNDALTLQGHEVINVSSVGAQVTNKLKNCHRLVNFVPWCILSKIHLGILMAIYKPDIILAHGNRAMSFAKAFKAKATPLVGVSHNYSYKYLKKCDYVLTLTNKLKEHLIAHGFDAGKLLSIANMVRITHEYQPMAFRAPIIIGSMGRFVAQKGFVYLIESIGLLKQAGHDVRLLLGGDGADKALLIEKTKALKLENEVIFSGWVEDKDAFFQQIDIFCSPTIIEPFGMLVLEAIEHSKPVIATKSGGPEETIRNGQDGLLAEIESASDLANKLQLAIKNQDMSHNMARSAYERLKENYDIAVVSGKLSKILSGLVNK